MTSTKMQTYGDDVERAITGKKRKKSKDFFSEIELNYKR